MTIRSWFTGIFAFVICAVTVAQDSCVWTTVTGIESLIKDKLEIMSQGYRHYPIVAGADKANKYIKEKNTEAFLKRFPYAGFLPSPYYYTQDIFQADKRQPFLVAGVNCDKTIAEMPTLTGVPMETLSLRARGHMTRGQFAGVIGETKRSEWKGVTNVGMRSSGDGFISRKYVYSAGESEADRSKSKHAMRELLLQDNKGVKALGLTHQRIAEPILQAMKGRVLYDKSSFTFNGEVYQLSVEQMGGSVESLVDHMNLSEKDLKKEQRLKESGWTGYGVQGSLFNDELFSNKLYTITKHDPKTGAKQSITIDGLTPHLIYRYGFYQGGDYRQKPEDIAAFFNLKPNQKAQQAWANCN